MLCSACGLVTEHARECKDYVSSAKTPEERAERALGAMRVADAALAAVQPLLKTEPRRAILQILDAETILERNPSKDLTSFEHKRAFNDAETRLKKARREAEDALAPGEGARLVEDVPFARKAIEVLFSLRKTEAQALDASVLAKLPTLAIASAESGNLKKINDEIEQRIEETRPLDAQVSSWGMKNLRALMTGRDPVEIPQELQGGGVANLLGALVGRGAASRRADASTKFHVLGDKFRERLYLLGANAIVLRAISRLAQVTEAWKRQLQKGGTERWGRVMAEEKELVLSILGSAAAPGEAGDPDAVVTAMAQASPGAGRFQLVAFDAVQPDDWDVWAKAYFFELAAIMGGNSSRDVSMESVARAILLRQEGVELDKSEYNHLIQSVRDMWHMRPPGELRLPIRSEKPPPEKA